MPITYSIDNDLGVIFTTATEVLTENELIEHKRKLVSDPDFRPGLVELSDVRQVSDLAVSPEGIQKMVAQDASDAEHLKDFKLAIVVPGSVEFGMGVMYEIMSSENEGNVRVFRDMSHAKVWLGI